MLRASTRKLMFGRTVACLEKGATGGMPIGNSFGGGGVPVESQYAEFAHPNNSRGQKSSAQFIEESVATYDAAIISFTYMEPHKVKVDKLPEPDKASYQRFTKRSWDLSSTEWMELITRKRMVLAIWWFTIGTVGMLSIPKDRQFSGKGGADGFYVLLQKGTPEAF